MIRPHLSPDHWPVFLEAVSDLRRYNLLQPALAVASRDGVAARRRQWHRMTGGRAGRPNHQLVVAGAAAGLVVGAILGLAIPADVLPIISTPVLTGLTGLAGIPIGGYLAHLFGSQGAYHEGMMLVVVNERRSIITPEMVTGQVEVWIPKPLLAWRAHEWRYTEGRPYMWLQLPPGEQIHARLKSTLDYLLLPNDLYRAKDAAVYALRSWNRMISDCALDCADVDEGEDAAGGPLKELMPFLVAGCIVLAGILLVLLTMD